MSFHHATPIIIGVGDVRNNPRGVKHTIELLQLMLDAISLSLKDCGLNPSATRKLQSDIDSVDVVACSTWPYADLPGLVSEKMGIDVKHKHYSYLYGSKPVRLLDDMAKRISNRQNKVALMTGGEALASCTYNRDCWVRTRYFYWQ